MANRPALRADLAELRRTKVKSVDSYDWRTLRASVSLKWPNPKLIFKRDRNAVRQLLGASHHDSQTPKIFSRAAPRVGVQEGWRRQEHCHRMLAYERANRPRIEWARMKNRADSRRSRQTKCSRKSERMKKG